MSPRARDGGVPARRLAAMALQALSRDWEQGACERRFDYGRCSVLSFLPFEEQHFMANRKEVNRTIHDFPVG